MEPQKPKQHLEKKGRRDVRNIEGPCHQAYNEPPAFDMSTEYWLLVREMTTAFALHRMIWDEDGKPLDFVFLEVNRKFEELTGLDSAQLIGKRVREVLPGLEQSWIDIYGEVAKTGKPAEFENYSRELDRFYEVKAYCPKAGYFAVTFNDVTPKKKKALKLNEIKSFYEAILNTVNEGIVVADQSDVIYFVNASLETTTGMNAGDLTGKNVLTDFPDELIREFLPSYREAKKSGLPVQYEGQGLMPDGRKLTLSGWLIPLKKGNRYDGMISSVSDITEKKQAELRIRESEQRFRALAGSAPNIIFSTNRELQITYINKTIDNTPAGNVIGMNVYDLTPQNEVPRVKKYIAKLFRTKREVQYEIASKNEFGDYWLDVRAAPIIYGNEIEGLIFILTDITKRKKAEEKLAGSEERFRGLMDKSPVAMIVGDQKGNTLYLNERFVNTFGYTIKDIPNVNLWWNLAFPDPEYREKIIQEWNEENEKVKRGEPAREFSESYITCKDGTVRYIRALWSIFDDNVIIMLNDLTESKKLEQEIIRQKQEIEKQNDELREAKQKAEESDRLKSAFLANMSHEIRTPMNSIIGFSSLLAEPGTSPEMLGSYCELIQNSGEHLLRIIDDIVDIAKIESNQLKIKKGQIGLAAFLDKVYMHHSRNNSIQGNVNLELRLNLSNLKEGLQIYTDEVRLKQVLDNFVVNAIKYTEKGFIEIGVLPDHSSQGPVTFYVKDTGTGIPADKTSVIFERFIRLEKNKPAEGNGLGLSISKGIAILLGGKISVDSTEGIGSTFYFSLPSDLVLM